MRFARPIIALTGLALALGCGRAMVQFNPVQGPMASLRPVPLVLADTTGLVSGTIALTLPDGESYRGPWRPMRTIQMEPGDPVNASLAGINLAQAWDLVYGPGFFNATVLGSRLRAVALLKGDRGGVIQLEINHQGDQQVLEGVAVDGRGNTYKLTQ